MVSTRSKQNLSDIPVTALELAPVARMRSTAAVASNPPIRAGRNRGRGARARGGRGGRAAVAPATGARGHGRGRGGRAPAAPAAPAIAPSTVVAPVAAAPPAAATAPIAPRAASAPPSVVPASAPGAGVAPAVSAPAPAVAAFAPAATVARASSAPASAAPVKLALCKNCNFLRRRIGRRDRTIKQKNEKILDLERKLLVYRKLNRRIQAQAEAATASFDNANAVIRLMGGVGVGKVQPAAVEDPEIEEMTDVEEAGQA